MTSPRIVAYGAGVDSTAMLEPNDRVVAAHAQLRSLRSLATARSGFRFFERGETVGVAEDDIVGVGRVRIEAQKELVERRRGVKVRRRYRFYLDGARATERNVYERARAIR